MMPMERGLGPVLPDPIGTRITGLSYCSSTFPRCFSKRSASSLFEMLSVSGFCWWLSRVLSGNRTGPRSAFFGEAGFSDDTWSSSSNFYCSENIWEKYQYLDGGKIGASGQSGLGASRSTFIRSRSGPESLANRAKVIEWRLIDGLLFPPTQTWLVSPADRKCPECCLKSVPEFQTDAIAFYD